MALKHLKTLSLWQPSLTWDLWKHKWTVQFIQIWWYWNLNFYLEDRIYKKYCHLWWIWKLTHKTAAREITFHLFLETMSHVGRPNCLAVLIFYFILSRDICNDIRHELYWGQYLSIYECVTKVRVNVRSETLQMSGDWNVWGSYWV